MLFLTNQQRSLRVENIHEKKTNNEKCNCFFFSVIPQPYKNRSRVEITPPVSDQLLAHCTVVMGSDSGSVTEGLCTPFSTNMGSNMEAASGCASDRVLFLDESGT